MVNCFPYAFIGFRIAWTLILIKVIDIVDIGKIIVDPISYLEKKERSH